MDGAPFKTMNLSRWTYTFDSNTPPWAMDARHIDMVAAAVMLSGIESAVEIGCLNGRSTTAFVEAVEAGAPLKWLGLCDPEPTDSLRRVMAEMPREKTIVELLAKKSGAIHWMADLWLIDGNHEYDFVSHDFNLACASGASVIILHDTNHHAFDGPRRVLEEVHLRFPNVFHDKAHRAGEETERGIAFLFTKQNASTGACIEALHQLAK